MTPTHNNPEETTVDIPVVMDPHRSFRRDDRHAFAAIVADDGATQLWALDLTLSPRDGLPTIQVPDHERLGPLPRQVLDRLGLRCGAPCTSAHGRSCRNVVAAYGDRCRAHQHAAAQPTLDLGDEVCA